MATTIEYNIKVNDQGAVTTIGDLEQQLSDLNEEIKQVPVNSKRFQELKKEINSVETDLEGANQALARFTAEDKVRAFQGSIDLLGGTISGAAGAAALFNIESEKFDELTARAAGAIAFSQGLKQSADGAIALTQSLQKSAKAQKLFAAAQKLVNLSLTTFKGALIATGIGAFVVALGLIVANFDKVQAAVKKFVGNSKILTSVVDTVIDGFNALVDTFRPVLEFLGLIPDEVERAEIATREFAAEQATQAEKEIQRARARGAAAEELFALEEKILQNKIKASTDAEEQEQLRFELELARLKEEKRLKDEAAKADEERRAKRKQQQEEDEAEAQRIADEKKAKAEEEAQAEQERIDSIEAILQSFRDKQRDLDAQTELEKIALEEERKLAELERLQATEEEKQAIRDFYAQRKSEAEAAATEQAIENAKTEADEKIAAALAEKEARAQIEMAKYTILAQFGGLLGELAGENKELQIAAVIAQQAAAIGQIVSATGIANAKAVAASPLTAGQPWVTINTVSAGLAIATAVAQAAKSISQIKSAGGNSSPAAGGAVPRGGSAAGGANANGAAATSPFQQFTPTGISPETQQADTTVRAYVVAGDVTSTQEANARLDARREID